MKFSAILVGAALLLSGASAAPPANSTLPTVFERQTGTAPGCGIKPHSQPRRHCYCSGAVEFGNVVGSGIHNSCESMGDSVIQPGQTVVRTHKRSTPSNTIYYSVRNFCNTPQTLGKQLCKDQFSSIKKYCEWTFDTHKGGTLDGSCFHYNLDVQAK